MAQFQLPSTDILDCIDAYQDIKDAQFLIESMTDAVIRHWHEPNLKEHLYYLLVIYNDKVKEALPKMKSKLEQLSVNEDRDDKLRNSINN